MEKTMAVSEWRREPPEGLMRARPETRWNRQKDIEAHRAGVRLSSIKPAVSAKGLLFSETFLFMTGS
jgi:hypothetical protein